MSLIIGLGNNGSGVGSMKQVIVDELPDVGKSGIVYLVPKDDPELEDAYDEYIWIKQTSSWEKIGTTHIDLTNYVSVEQQSFTEAQKALARLNIGAASNSDIPELPEEIVLQEDAGETAYGTDYDPYISSVGVVLLNFTNSLKLQARDNIEAYSKPPGGIQKADLASDVQTSLGKADTALQEHQSLEEYAKKEDLENGNLIPALAYNLEAWADQKAIATPDTYTDAVRTTGGDIPIETSAGSKLESIKPVVGSKWTAKMLFNGSYNMLNAAKWGAANSQPYVGGVGNDFVYFLVPELTLGTFGTADENNGILFTDEDGVNVQPSSVYFKPLGATVPQSLTDGTSITPTNVSYDGKTYKDYATSGAGWMIVPKTIYDNDVCAHIAWEDWYDKHVSLNEPSTNPEAVIGALMLEDFLVLIQSDKYLRAVNETVNDHIIFGETSATGVNMVGELSVAANAWTNAATGESDSQGNALYKHSTTVSGIKQGGAASLSDGTPMSIVGTTASYVDTNATAGAGVVYYELPTTTTIEKAYTDSVFSGSTIDTDTGVLPINDCSIEAQVGMDGEANITVKYAKNIVDQVAINATVDVPQIKRQVEEHEERITELEDTAVRTGSYDASVAVGLADNFKGDTIVDAEFYKRKTGGTQSVGSGIAAIKEMRGKSIVWNQQIVNSSISDFRNKGTSAYIIASLLTNRYVFKGHKVFVKGRVKFDATISGVLQVQVDNSIIKTISASGFLPDTFYDFSAINTVNTENWHEFRFYAVNAGEATKITWENVNITDLTLMFGAGNEPATVEEFEKMFQLDYYDYNAGEVIPFAGQNLVTIGFNQWDEQWEVGSILFTNGNTASSNNRIRSKNFIRVIGGATYYVEAPSDSIVMFAYTESKDYIGAWANNGWSKSGCQSVAKRSITMPNDCAYIKIRSEDSYGPTYNNDICINISDPDRNGTYEPYEKHTLPLDPSQWRDKNGNLVFPYGGMHGVGTAYDYAKVDADGYIRKANSVYGGIDVGDYNYTKQGNLYTTDGFVPPKANVLFGRGKGLVWNQTFSPNEIRSSQTKNGVTYTNNQDGTISTSGTAVGESILYMTVGKVVTAGHKYLFKCTPEGGSSATYQVRESNAIGFADTGSGVTFTGTSSAITLSIHVYDGYNADGLIFKPRLFDLTLMFGVGNEPTTPEEFEAMFPLDYYAYDKGSLGILANQNYNDAAAFKTAMQGVPLIYELAEPVEVELATPIYAKYLVDKDGTEEVSPANGSTPYTTMANLSILYAMDARGEIKNLPKNYLSKESAENMLNAMVTAGVIASYTMTYDAASGRYTFVITKPA